MEGGALSYGELAERATVAADGFPELMVVDRPPGPSFAVLLHGAWLAGTAIRPATLEAWGSGDAPKPQELPNGTLAVMYTSGTTGAPRAVCLTRTHFEASARASAARLPLEPDDRWLCCLAVRHIAGLSIFTRCAYAGAAVYAEPDFDAGRVKDLLETGEVTVASLVPTMLIRLRDAGLERAPNVKGVLLGGGPIPADLLDWALDTKLPVMPTYGMTETCSQIATARPGERLGRPLPGAEIKIADDGEILVRGPMVAADGWLHTGDRGRLTDDGLLEVYGRMDDLIVTGGENVAAAEVEAVLREHPGVTDAAVIGIDDPEWGKAVVGFVVAATSSEEIDAHARARLPGFKVPKEIFVVDDLPRTASGKVERAKLESRADDLRQRR